MRDTVILKLLPVGRHYAYKHMTLGCNMNGHIIATHCIMLGGYPQRLIEIIAQK